MIRGRRHVHCGRINWHGKDQCTCRPFGNDKTIYQFTDVIFDNPKIEDLAAKAKRFAELMVYPIELSFDAEHENEQGDPVGCLILDGWIIIYPEKIEKDSLIGKVMVEVWAIDTTVHYGGSRYEPPSEDYARVGTYEHWTTALCAAFKLMFDLQLNYTAEALQMEECHTEREII